MEAEIVEAEWQTHVKDSAFIESIMKDVYGPRKGGAIVFIDAQNARRGIAKTSAQIAVGRLLSTIFGYDLQEQDLTLSGDYYLKRALEQPGKEQPSVLGIDEFVGAGSGDKRRAMAAQNVFFGSVWQMIRKKRIVTLATLPDWNEADKRLRKYADYRLWCLENPIGHFQPYKVKVPFQAGTQAPVYLQGLGRGPDTERITFPNMDDRGDPLYEYITDKKDDVIDDGSFDADKVEERIGLDESESDDEQLSEKEIARKEKQRVALRMYKPWTDQVGSTSEAVAHAIDMSDSWVRTLGSEWSAGKHRDIMPVPDDEPTELVNNDE